MVIAMSLESILGQGIAEPMIRIPAGGIVLRDEGAKTSWTVDLGAFELAPYPVTRDLYDAVRGEAPASSAGPRTPVTEVSWKEAVRFCNLLSERRGLKPCYSMGEDLDGQDVVCDWDAGGYRLPSEAEWEYACRVGRRAAARVIRPSASRTLGSGLPDPCKRDAHR